MLGFEEGNPLSIPYWEAGLRIIDIIREDISPNKTTPVVVLFPGLGESQFEAGDRLSSESVKADLSERQPATIISEVLTTRIVDALRQHLSS